MIEYDSLEAHTTFAGQSGLPDQAGELLQAYMQHLEQGGHELPHEFLQTFQAAGQAVFGDFKEELLQALRSIRLVHDAGRNMASQEPDFSSLPEQGTRLGDFEINYPLGRGGMGIVFMARQISLDRPVALKILTSASRFDEQAKARFKLEAKAAATLAHPNIVPVFAIGNHRDVDFYAMQFIDGNTLQQMIETKEVDRSKTLAESKTPPIAENPKAQNDKLSPATPDPTAGNVQRTLLGIDQSIRIAIQIADALQHAHRAGIVHRDVKPSNILLDNSGKPWLADFGLAHIEQQASLTAPGAIIGSLRYMSPEQIDPQSNQIDYRSDIYGLGVTLYEILAGRPAIGGRDRLTITQNVASGNIPNIRLHNPSVSRDLNTVIGKAVQKESHDRYHSAEELASDLRAVLERRPIRARPPRLSDHIAKWAARNQRLVQTAAVFLLLALVTLSIAFWQVRRANVATRQKNRQLTVAQEAAHQNLILASNAINDFYSNAHDQLKEFPVTARFRRQLSEKSQEYYSALMAANEQSPIPREALAHAQFQIATVRMEQTQFEQAALSLQSAISICDDQLQHTHHRSALLLLKYQSHFLLAQVLQFRQQLNPSLEQLTLAKATHAEIRDRGEQNERWQRDGISIALQHARVLEALGKLDRALQISQSANADAVSLVERLPRDDWARIRRVEAELTLAKIQQQLKEPQAAQQTLVSAHEQLDVLKQSSTVDLSRRKLLASAELQMGQVKLNLQDLAGAVDHFQNSRKTLMQLLAEDPDNGEFRYHQILATIRLAETMAQQQNEAESNRLYEELELALQELKIQDEPFGMSHLELGGVIHNLGLRYLNQQEFETAAKYFEQARDLSQQALAANPNSTLAALNLSNHYYSLSRVHFETRQLEHSAKDLQQAAKWREHYLTQVPDDNQQRWVLSDIHMVWPKVLGKLGRWTEALSACQRGIEIADEWLDKPQAIKDPLKVQSVRNKRQNLLIGMTEIAYFARDLEKLEKTVQLRVQDSVAKAGNTKPIVAHLEYLYQLPDAQVDQMASSRQTIHRLIGELKTQEP